MPVKSYKLGPGTLTIGAVGSALDLSAQITACRLTPSVDTEDSLTTLSGDTLAGARTYSWALSATLVQDLTDDGMVDYTWDNAGSEVPFTYVPSTAAGRSFSGVVIVDPIEVGGDVGQKPTTDIEWAVVGQPTRNTDLT